MKLFFLSLLLTATASCNDKYPDLGDGLYAEIVTSKGTMVAKLHYDKVPVTVANFVSLAEGTNKFVDTAYTDKRFYNGLTFHRVIKDFMIQGGDPLANGLGNPGYRFKDEFDPSLKHDKKGILSMANSGYLGTNGSQFFITHKETPWLDAYDENGELRQCENPRVGCHSVFGEIVIGLNYVDAIEQKDVIQEMNIIRKGKDAKKFDAAKIFTDYFEEAEREAKEKAEKLEKHKAEVKVRLDKLKLEAETLPSGLQYVFTKKGDGPKPKLGNRVTLNYAGYLAADGALVDTNLLDVASDYDDIAKLRARGQRFRPMTSVYSSEARLISGFKEGMQLMSVGDKITLFIPSHLGYGAQGAGEAVPANADIVFELELLEILK